MAMTTSREVGREGGPTTYGVARRRRAQAQRSLGRHVGWLTDLLQATSAHHTAGCALGELLKRLDHLERKVEQFTTAQKDPEETDRAQEVQGVIKKEQPEDSTFGIPGAATSSPIASAMSSLAPTLGSGAADKQQSNEAEEVKSELGEALPYDPGSLVGETDPDTVGRASVMKTLHEQKMNIAIAAVCSAHSKAQAGGYAFTHTNLLEEAKGFGLLVSSVEEATDFAKYLAQAVAQVAEQLNIPAELG